MTAPTRPSSRYRSDDSLMDWFNTNKMAVSWALLALVVVVGGLWFFQRSRTMKEQNAEKAYYQARQAAVAGNLPLAVSDLKKVVTRYEGTRAGTQAAMFLAQGLFEQKKPQEGINELKAVLDDAPEDFVPSIHVLIGNGFEELKNFASAAESYREAAEATDFPAEKASYQAFAGRAYMAAGKAAEARAIWAELAKDETGPIAAEARVRLGELEARPMRT